MRFATIRSEHGPKAVVQVGNNFVDVSAVDSSIPNSVRGILAGGDAMLAKVNAAAAAANAPRIAVADAQYLPPIPDPQKILCIGLNYRDHALEGGREIPTEPVLFGKFANTLIAHGESIRLPKVSAKVDYEAELVVVIGKAGRDISEADAWDYVGGYTVGHDVSGRDWQFRGAEKQWIIGKSFDTFAPTGPVMVTKDEIPNPHELQVQLRLNGQTMQNSNTREFIFGIPKLLAFLSQVITLEPGDLLFTGTPPGVGVARKPPVFLKPGDVVEVEIESIGLLRNSCIAQS
ncbi:fumarylacetoacetate hydrolase family protein [Tuwongella immobilis]|uniref:Fumarylacetoacetase-like C-terminal domain-containing protein n=1 Tax=Tuwongella immobilis TaxID=692036 RepID=A0A6C2YTQ7_9BACT|nr:fumarylacetoacetate hydrolase family protein [Tuwongella immobilis]VIP04866.1 fumarylacetoacetate hydrolase : 2-keto-4-pentenoate hydratase/2-oxohepta-3-ene-1,7-dioic acid hydratase OS=Singulisphaera acidiphila (strain ATCC BAA-1392 / DSM 18658 / VKM B-2454 / MOB10) GN=Sinac_7292 PE=4 SV=1: FAA_hydrolase [Tuwongella immobilis]VTS07091.1 fumarylacetoacetate hydrolase : 2-keto-4-pentenoate hydratase/2-oxohepta-3-ene-1,7-dioic acid hydratase OS=Singulisphaera acidiphila (strain ATCC BAA-1392 / DS